MPIRRSGLDDRELDALSDELDEDLTEGLVRAASEVLTNARKHSRGSHVSVHISRNADSITIEMRDDGIGFEGPAPGGHGLANSVFARAHDLGFTASVHSAPGQGTRVTLTAPLRERPVTVETTMNVSVNTAKQYINRVKAKYTAADVQARTRLDLGRIAWAEGYVEPSLPQLEPET